MNVVEMLICVTSLTSCLLSVFPTQTNPHLHPQALFIFHIHVKHEDHVLFLCFIGHEFEEGHVFLKPTLAQDLLDLV